jgi:magnesium transporter
VRRQGADYLAYLIIDAIVDNYFNIIEDIGWFVENTEEEVLERPDRETIHAIHALKNEMLFIRKNVFPAREVIIELQRSDSELIKQSTGVHFRDVYDHTVQVMDMLDTYRDIISNMLDTYLSSLSNRMNEVMKVLTIISTIFIPLTFLAGVYGMNFKYFPELSWPWSYPLFWVTSVVIAAGMLYMFKKKQWI